MTPRTITMVFLGFALGGCATRPATWDTATLPPIHAGLASGEEAAGRRAQALAEGQQYWAQRADQAALRNAIARFEDALTYDEAQPEEWARVSRGYFFLADGFLSDDPANRTEMLATYERGIVAAERGLLVSNATFAERVRAGVRFVDAVPLLDTSATGCLFWRAANLSRFMTSQGLGAQIASRDEVFVMLDRALALDDGYYYGGSHRVLGKLFASMSGYQGGDPARSREQYERALEQAPQYWPTRVEYAENWAVAARDRDAFERQLHFVLTADPSVDPAVAPENAAAQRRAQTLLDKEAQLFR